MGRNPLLWLILLASCGGANRAPIDAPDANRDQVAAYQLFYGDQPIGVATERFRAGDDGFVLMRRERIRVQRAGADVLSETSIRVSGANPSVPNRIEWTTTSGEKSRIGTAERQGSGWAVRLEGGKNHWVAGDATPWELLPWLNAPPDGPVILPGLGFATGELTSTRTGPTLELVLTTHAGPLRTQVTVDKDGRWQRIVSGAVRAERSAREPVMPAHGPDVIAGSAIAVTGTPSAELVLEPIDRPAPPAFAGQKIRVESGRWVVEFSALPWPQGELAQILTTEVTALRGRLSPSTKNPQDFAGSAGDCTAFATALIERLVARGRSARAVTGFRIDEGKLYRHRWVEVLDGHYWIAVDPTYGLTELPRGRYLALARHGSTFSDVTLTDEVTFAGTGRARATYR